MKTFFLVCALFAVAFARPAETEEPVEILSQENENGFDGSFTNNFESDDGISVQQKGVSKLVDEKPVQEITGSYSYTAPDGTEVKVDYIANENGFQPTGNVLPVIPEAIARAIKFIKENPPKAEVA